MNFNVLGHLDLALFSLEKSKAVKRHFPILLRVFLQGRNITLPFWSIPDRIEESPALSVPPQGVHPRETCLKLSDWALAEKLFNLIPLGYTKT